jgi:hypothetical protein
MLSAFIVPFLLLAFAVLFPWPNDTRRLFAWQIKPTLSAMVLGAVYLGGAYFFLRAVRASEWHTVAGGFPPVATFAGLMGVTTLLHWNRFLHGNVAFWLWVALYLTTPFLVLAVYIRNRAEADGAIAGELLLPTAAAWLLVFAGGLSLVTGAFLYLFPYRAIDAWPWTLTPLTARMLGAIFALGLAGLGAYRERRWTSARLLLQVAGVMLVLIVIAGLRAHSEFDGSNPLTWLFTAGFAGTAIVGAAFYLSMEARFRAGVPRGGFEVV